MIRKDGRISRAFDNLAHKLPSYQCGVVGRYMGAVLNALLTSQQHKQVMQPRFSSSISLAGQTIISQVTSAVASYRLSAAFRVAEQT